MRRPAFWLKTAARAVDRPTGEPACSRKRPNSISQGLLSAFCMRRMVFVLVHLKDYACTCRHPSNNPELDLMSTDQPSEGASSDKPFAQHRGHAIFRRKSSGAGHEFVCTLTEPKRRRLVGDTIGAVQAAIDLALAR